jgi:hypothetical protein
MPISGKPEIGGPGMTAETGAAQSQLALALNGHT